MSNIFGKGGGGGGGGGGGKAGLNIQDVVIPPFESAGGITPEQQTLGDYQYGQNLLANENLYASSGTPQSTMTTQGAEGARSTEALAKTGMSDTNQGAKYNLYQNDVSALETDLQNQSVINQFRAQESEQTLQGLAAALGQFAGSNSNFNTPA